MTVRKGLRSVPMDDSLTAAVTQYVGERLARGEIVHATANALRLHLYCFAASYGARPIMNLSVRAVERWVEQMTTAGLAPSTKAARLSSLRVFARWCVLRGVVAKDFTIGAPVIRRPRQTPRDMTNEHAELVLHACRSERERLIVLLMFGAGLRCVEVHRLNVDDFDRGSCTLFVTGKAGHQREVPVPPVVVSAMRSYLAAAGHATGPLIRSEVTGGRLGPERISGLVGHLVRLSGVKIDRYDGRSAHGLRAAAASDLFDACLDVRVVQQFLGHANIQTTDVYLRRSKTGQVMDAQMRRPLAGPTAA